MPRPTFLVIAAIVILASAHNVAAQDSHYWAQAYGTSSRLLGGTVIGSVKDLSAGFYNPGAISLVGGAKFVVSARVFQLEVLNINPAAGAAEGRTDYWLRPAPSFFAGMFTTNPERTNQWGFIYLPRQAFKARINDQAVETRDVLPGEPGAEVLTAAILLDSDLNEYWGGVIWGRRIRDHLGVGATGFVAYRGQRYRYETLLQTYSQSGAVGQSTLIRDFSYWNVRTLAKLGVMYNASPFKLGVSVTTPSLNLFGDGNSFVDIVRSGVDIDNDGSNDDFYATDFQENQKSQFLSSWAIGVGASYQPGATELTVSAEYYAPIDQFELIETTDFQAQSTGQTLPNQVVAEYGAVLNWGLGAQHRFTKHVAVYGAFTTDFSAIVAESSNSTVTTWDLYHISAGGEFSIRKFHITLGLEWAFGRDTVDGIDLSNIEEADSLSDPGGSDVRYDRVTIILGIQLGGENL